MNASNTKVTAQAGYDSEADRADRQQAIDSFFTALQGALDAAGVPVRLRFAVMPHARHFTVAISKTLSERGTLRVYAWRRDGREYATVGSVEMEVSDGRDRSYGVREGAVAVEVKQVVAGLKSLIASRQREIAKAADEKVERARVQRAAFAKLVTLAPEMAGLLADAADQGKAVLGSLAGFHIAGIHLLYGGSMPVHLNGTPIALTDERLPELLRSLEWRIAD